VIGGQPLKELGEYLTDDLGMIEALLAQLAARGIAQDQGGPASIGPHQASWYLTAFGQVPQLPIRPPMNLHPLKLPHRCPNDGPKPPDS
jgi:hypothetical protein